jgi:hypothetical protein
MYYAHNLPLHSTGTAGQTHNQHHLFGVMLLHSQNQARLKTDEGSSTPQLAVRHYPLTDQKPGVRDTLVVVEAAPLMEGEAKRKPWSSVMGVLR